MIIRFGLELGEQAYPAWNEKIDAYVGESGLLHLLEVHLGLGYPDNLDFLRVEQYRQVLQYYKNRHPDVFYAESFEADALATADALLSRRDELLLAAWDFIPEENMPLRLKVLAEIETLLRLSIPSELSAGFADRFVLVLNYLEEEINLPIKEIQLHEPLELLPPYLQRLFICLENSGIKLIAKNNSIKETDSDLSNFKNALLKRPFVKGCAKADGSLIILRTGSESYAAAYLSKFFKLNPNFKPLCLLSDKNRALDNAMIQEGLPSFGVLSASLSRPTLQILKLAPAFLWKPVNPYKLLEFLSLPNIPIPKGLAIRLAAAISEKPGLFNSSWYGKKNAYFEDFDTKIEKAETKKGFLQKEKKKAEKEYLFWFERKRYDIRSKVPARDVKELFNHIKQWALVSVDDLNKKIDRIEKNLGKSTENSDKKIEDKELLIMQQQPLLTLYLQSDRLIMLLETLPENEQQLSYLQLERLVKTINEPTQMPFRFAEVGHLPFVYTPSAISETSEDTLWWNFLDNNQNPGFERWYSSELNYLQNKNAGTESLITKNNRQLWQRMQPVLRTQKRLILVYPDAVNGRSVNPHPLWGDLHATFGSDLSKIQVHLEEEKNIELLQSIFQLPVKVQVQSVKLQKAEHFVEINNNTGRLQAREIETFTGLDSLLYYPYQWTFRYVLGLNNSSILSIVKQETLKGNLAHSAFEKIFNEIKRSAVHWDKNEVQQWMEKEIPNLFEREGAVLLMYGQEAERRAFINLMKHSAWSLISAIQENGWSIEATEEEISGELGNQQLKGKADLILKRGEETAVVDLKFRSAERYKELIRDKEDLQLVIYSRFATKSEDWAHTAYFIISNAKLLARNNAAFKEAETLMPNEDYKTVNEQIWDKMHRTYEWRLSQIVEGKIEIRNKETIKQLEEVYKELDLLSMLEMSTEAPYYDIYQVLVGSGLTYTK